MFNILSCSMGDYLQHSAENFIDNIAIKDSNGAYTYRELMEISDQICRTLHERGLKRGDVVALFFHQSKEAIAAALGALKAGCCFAPMDVSDPVARLQFINKDCTPAALLIGESNEELAKQVASHRQVIINFEQCEYAGIDRIAPQAVSPETLACIFYTSGSTGEPKGVCQSHRNLLHFANVYGKTLGLHNHDILSMLYSLNFSASNMDIFSGLMNGATLDLYNLKEKGIDGLSKWLDNERVTILHTIPTVLRYLVNDSAEHHIYTYIRAVDLGGEPVYSSDIDKFQRCFSPKCRIINHYAATEASVIAQHEIDFEYSYKPGILPVGKPAQDLRVTVTAENGEPAATNEVGQITIFSPFLSPGYWNRPELTEKGFIEVNEKVPVRGYHSGDLGFFDDNGNLNYLGRSDCRVKIRGFRIELGEIESALNRHPRVQDSVVVSFDANSREKQIAAYVVTNPDFTSTASSELRSFLSQTLPSYMIPSVVISCRSFPLTPNGKIDRKALPIPEATDHTSGIVYGAPRTPMEQTLVTIWQEVLGLKQVGIHENFFALGGHSLLAARVISQVRALTLTSISVRTFFDWPTIAQLASRIEALRSQKEDEKASPLHPQNHNGPIPLSFAQQRLWFLYQLEPASAAYNISLAFRLGGRLDVAALKKSLQFLVDRHETLRTSFPLVDHKPTQVIADSLVVPFTQQDLRGMSDVNRESTTQALVQKEGNRPFDLATGPVLRTLLAQLADEERVLVLTLHHIVSDGWSLEVLNRELEECYSAFTTGAAPTLPALPIQYANFAERQRAWLEGGVLEEQLAYWRKQLADMPYLALPTDHPRPPVQTQAGANHTLVVSHELAQALRGLSRKGGVTLAITLLAAFKVLLAKYTGQTDLTVGTPFANRNQQEIEGLIGFFVNSLVMRTDLGGDPSWWEVLQRVKVGSLEAYDHPDLPFDRIVEELQPERDPSRNPLFQVLFAVQNIPIKELTLPGLTVTSIQTHITPTRFDLECHIWEQGKELAVKFVYNTDLFETGTIERFGRHYQRVLEAVVRNPEQRLSQIALLDEAERQQQLVEWNNTATERPPLHNIHQFFEQQVQYTPAGIAMILEDRHCTYQELNHRANQLAHYLIRMGVGPDVWVGLCLTRSFDMTIGLLGILKAGGGFVPLDPDYPTDRLAFMLEDSQITIVVSQKDLLPRIPLNSSNIICLERDWKIIEKEDSRNPTSRATRENVAYAVYTSGSTGRPKGVMVCHRTLINLSTWQITTHQSFHATKTLQYASLGFDVSYQEMFATWCSGGTLVLVPSKIKNDFSHLLQFLEQEAVERAFLPFVALQELARIAESQAIPPSKFGEVITAGEQLHITNAIANVFRHSPDGRLINHYGPSESHVVTSYRLEGEPDVWPALPPIGSPIDNSQIYLLDRSLHPVPMGVIGEIYIAGEGLARGYLHQPAKTAEKFLPHPHSQGAVSGQRIYRSGDLGRYRPDGTIEFCGRDDHQIKLRGYRIELGEIEAALRQHHGVAETVVLCREDMPGEKQLVAYVTSDRGALDVPALRVALQGRLPSYMVPSAFVVLETLPLTPNGKIDRKALPAPEVADRIQGMTYVAPRTPIEQTLIAIWQEVLGFEQVGIHDNFFELGGHSLLATQVVSRVRTQLQVEVTLLTFFQVPTVAGLAERLVPSADAVAQPIVPPLTPCARTNPLPLSFAQQRLWFLDQWEPNSALYNVASVFRLRGLLHVNALRNALMALVKRHESLRTIFLVVDDMPCQHILDLEQLASLGLTIIEVLDKSGETRDATLHRMITEEICRPFDLTRGPLFRAQLLPVAENEAVFILTLHHIITDGWSMGVFFKELKTLYKAQITGHPSELPPLPLQYADFSIWQRNWLQGEVLDRQLRYWRTQLAEIPTHLDLPTDFSRPAQQSYRGEQVDFTLSPQLTQDLQILSQQEGVTLFMTLLAAFQVLLFRYTGQRDFLVGTPIAGRAHTELESLMGFFVNTLILRTKCTGQPTFRDVLHQVRETCLEAHAHQDLPFEKLVEQLQPARDPSRHPLFQILFQLHNGGQSNSLTMTDLQVETLRGHTYTAKFDLTLSMSETPDGLTGTLIYSTDLFEVGTITRLATHFETLLKHLNSRPDQSALEVPFLGHFERHQLLVDWNPPVVRDQSFTCIHDLLEAQAARTPDAVAVVDGGRHLTYRSIHSLANQLARVLQQHGVGPEVMVGLYLDKSLELFMGLLGILKAGGAYVPFDPHSPIDRVSPMMDQADLTIILMRDRSRTTNFPSSSIQVIYLDEILSELMTPIVQDLCVPIRSSMMAYMIFTSGSTGIPKGIVVSHYNMLNAYQAWAQAYHLRTQCTVHLQMAHVTFDVFTGDFIRALGSGGTLILCSRDTLLNPKKLYDLMKNEHVECAEFVPGVVKNLLDYVEETQNKLSFLRLLIVGSDVFEITDFRRLQQVCGSETRLINSYGLTETTIDSSYFEDVHGHLPQIGSVPIGRPLPNIHIFVLDQRQQPAPIGVTGEIYVGGEGLSRGYWDRPDLTAERFLPHPTCQEPGTRLYRTGDLGRYYPNGNLQLLGRADHQVKVRGFRIELGEIEAVLQQHPAVQETVVLCQENEESGEKQLIAYVVLAQQQPLPLPSLRQFLREKLPAFMVPVFIVPLFEFPRLPSGKINRRALPSSQHLTSTEDVVHRGPETVIEELLVKIWRELLNLPTVTVRDNFFELGGHSLLATRLLARLRGIGQSDLPLRIIFEHPILEDQALAIEEHLLKEIEYLHENEFLNFEDA